MQLYWPVSKAKRKIKKLSLKKFSYIWNKERFDQLHKLAGYLGNFPSLIVNLKKTFTLKDFHTPLEKNHNLKISHTLV